MYVVEEPNLKSQLLAVYNTKTLMPVAVAKVEESVSVVLAIATNTNVPLVKITVVKTK